MEPRDDDVTYALSTWTPDELAAVAADVRALGIEHEWDGVTLVVRRADEKRVDWILDGVEARFPRPDDRSGAAKEPESIHVDESRSGGWLAFLAVVFVAVVVVVALARSGDSKPNAPRPGSYADRMCDTNEVGPDVTVLGGKRYVEQCLDAYSWTEMIDE